MDKGLKSRGAYKERSQPNFRRKYGMLEKKKDYKKRAKNFQRKRDHIQKLKQKAAMRNPEEFYFKMVNSQKVNGIHRGPDESNKYSQKELVDMKTQDINYLQMKSTSEKKKIERLQNNLQMLQPTPKHLLKRRHTILVDTEEEVDNFNAEEYFDTPKELLNVAYNRPKRSDLDREDFIQENGMTRKQLRALEKLRKMKYKELYQRMERSKKLDGAVNDMRIKKRLMTKSGGVIKTKRAGEKPTYKWRRVRKR
eukprot:TRINITY_DN1172_c0_g1_i1.p1 TRINITY_DN1172_c0_g1~~TRINITY_DN1172_c0_g1_i1.p1  ORF type:complete len:252 (+),score=60.54 TRINITY_DN1172_c0_g1_i1:2-757(+)